MYFINYSELAGLTNAGFNKTEINVSVSGTTKTTTVYGGKANVTDPATADSRTDWEIMRSVIVEDGDTTTVTTAWSRGSWNDRASLTYKYL